MTFKVAPMCSKVHTIGNSGTDGLPGPDSFWYRQAQLVPAAEHLAQLSQARLPAQGKGAVARFLVAGSSGSSLASSATKIKTNSLQDFLKLKFLKI